MIDTRVVEDPRVSAAVKSAHMSALNPRFRRKQICSREPGRRLSSDWLGRWRSNSWEGEGGSEGVGGGEHTARITNSMNLFVALRPMAVAMALDQDEVSSVVVLLVVFHSSLEESGPIRGGALKGRREGGKVQFSKDAVEGRAGSAGGGERDPGAFEAHGSFLGWWIEGGGVLGWDDGREEWLGGGFHWGKWGGV